ncbi:unnamed protein product [Caenorhabditis sp. 36 PRJEB53466]|nr:unnamed protein product [Caenorhabditis sp. 36 PRJEB53466]
MTRPRKVQWADDDSDENQNQKNNQKKPESHKSLKSTTITKKLVQVRSYSGYAETLAVEKIVQTSPTQRKAHKFDRNLSTVREEEDDVSESDENV